MVRRRDNQGVEVLLLLVEHLPEVAVDPGGWVGLEDRSGEVEIEVAQSDDSFVLASVQVVLPHPADAHRGDGELVAGGLIARPSQHVARNHQRRQAGGDSGAPGQRAFG